MRALICRAWGSIDDLTVEEIAPPAPAADEVLIDVRATSVNYADSIMVAGKYQTRPPFPFSPGLETAGVVARGRALPDSRRHVLRRGGRFPHRLHLE